MADALVSTPLYHTGCYHHISTMHKKMHAVLFGNNKKHHDAQKNSVKI